MFNMELKHWAIVGGFLLATVTGLSGLETWADAAAPKVVIGVIGQIATFLVALGTSKPGTPS